MTALIHAELTKLRTIRTFAGLALGVIAMAAILAVAVSSVAGDGGNPELGTALFTRNLYSGAGLPLALALVAGVVHAAGEHQHGLAVPTYLVTPQRWRVIVAKLVTGAAFGLVLAVLSIVTTTVVGALQHAGQQADLFATFDAETARFVGTLLVVGVFYGVAGVSVGALVRNQLGAILLVLVWSQVVETAVLPTFLPDLSRWLPTELIASLGGATGRELLEPALAAVVLAAYALGLGAVAARVTDRADLA